MLNEQSKEKFVSVIKEYKLKGGEYTIESNGTIQSGNSLYNYREFGAEFKTKEQARQAIKYMRETNRLRALAIELDVYQEFKNNKANWYIYYDIKTECYSTSYAFSCNILGVVYMTQKGAQQVIDMLNNGEFEL